MSQWPPPPDLDSIRELMRDADIEGFIAIHGAPPDEYDTEADDFHAAIVDLPSQKITPEALLPILISIWRTNFAPDDAELAARLAALRTLVGQVAHFFGPEAMASTRPPLAARSGKSS